MANRTRLKGIKASRTEGHRPHHRKKSVMERRRLRILKLKENKEIINVEL